MAYRDGVAAARASYEAELAELHERADELDRAVPATLRAEIGGLVAETARPARSMPEVERATRVVRELGLALDVAHDMARMRRAARRLLWRRRLRVAGAATAISLLVGASVATLASRDLADAALDCAGSCAFDGLCHANRALFYEQVDWTERCVAETDADCAGPCAREGACTARDGRCVAASDAACRASEACVTDGLCSLVGATCSATSDADCRASTACRSDARCSVDAEQRRCAVRRATDCAASALCTEQRQCGFYQGSCVPEAVERCRTGEACETQGLCSPAKDGCAAVEDADCAFARACLDLEQCAAEGGRCVRARK